MSSESKPPAEVPASPGVYLQFPFCASKCTFCNFSSQVATAGIYDDYLRALEQEAALVCEPSRLAASLKNECRLGAATVYVGGGSPTLLGAERLGKLFSTVRKHFAVEDAREITIEITPGSADRALLETLLSLGFDRLSIGAQSFEDRELAATGRLHTAADTIEQVKLARRAGSMNLSLDLIVGLPYQTLESWRRSLQALAWLAPEHVSVYLFELDEKSRLGREVLRHGSLVHAQAVPSDDFMADAYGVAREFLSGEGYEQYEISNFARPGYTSIHNRIYWQRQPYLGLGAGAHSFDGSRRWANEADPVTYIQRLEAGELPIAASHRLGPEEHMEEFFFLGLRQQQGVSLEEAYQSWGSPPLDTWIAKVARLEREGLLQEREGRLSLAPHAYLVSNEIFAEFLT